MFKISVLCKTQDRLLAVIINILSFDAVYVNNGNRTKWGAEREREWGSGVVLKIKTTVYAKSSTPKKLLGVAKFKSCEAKPKYILNFNL